MKDAAWTDQRRLAGLRRFAVAITVLNILGHTVFGFEQAWVTPFVGLAAAYATELLLEFADARLQRRPPRFAGGLKRFIDFLLPAHISGLAVSMLLYANARPWPVAFAAAAALASKTILRAPVGKGLRHFYNPSNFGITLTLLLFPWVGIAPPYHFTENLSVAGDWILPGIIVCAGTFLNARFTKRLPLIAAWLSSFVLQALARHFLFDARIEGALLPMSGVAFLLFTFYMVTDPATTPSGTREQIWFGAAVAWAYGMLMACHIVFGLFFGLTAVATVRGAALRLAAIRARKATARPAMPVAATAMAAGSR